MTKSKLICVGGAVLMVQQGDLFNTEGIPQVRIGLLNFLKLVICY